MPNYCDNFLNIKGKQKDVVKFFNDFVDTDEKEVTFSMSKIFPEPSSPEDENYDWYNWRLENWGCKWDIDLNTPVNSIYDELIKIYDVCSECNIFMSYTTPWGPNLEFLAKASMKYPIEFHIKYYEPGCNLAGSISFKDGDATHYYENRGDNDFEYYKWLIENDFEDADFVLEEMGLEEYNKELYDRLNNYYNNSNDDVLDLSDVLLGNNLPKPE